MSDVDYKKLLVDLGEHNMPIAEFATVLRLDGVRFASKTRLNESFRDIDSIPLRDDVAQQVLKVWTEINMMQFWLYVMTGTSIKIDLSNGERVHEQLVDLRRRMAEESETRIAVQAVPSVPDANRLVETTGESNPSRQGNGVE